MAHSYCHLFTLPSVGLRFFTVYGPWGRPDMAMWLFTEAMPVTVKKRESLAWRAVLAVVLLLAPRQAAATTAPRDICRKAWPPFGSRIMTRPLWTMKRPLPW